MRYFAYGLLGWKLILFSNLLTAFNSHQFHDLFLLYQLYQLQIYSYNISVILVHITQFNTLERTMCYVFSSPKWTYDLFSGRQRVNCANICSLITVTLVLHDFISIDIISSEPVLVLHRGSDFTGWSRDCHCFLGFIVLMKDRELMWWQNYSVRNEYELHFVVLMSTNKYVLISFFKIDCNNRNGMTFFVNFFFGLFS